jgi:antitoxin component YwqK of YwqJK toxin-antitoxin module
MKKVFLIVCMLVPSLLIFGIEMRRSNAIGQDLGMLDGQQDYYLSKDENRTQLFGPDGLVWTEEEFFDADEKLVVRSYHQKDLHSSLQFVNGILQAKMVGDQTDYYRYSDDGKLEQITRFVDGVLRYSKIFAYDEIDGRLLHVITLEEDRQSIRYFTRFQDRSYLTAFSADGGQSFIRIGPAALIEFSFAVDDLTNLVSVVAREEGGFLVNRKGIVQTYDASGLLIEEASDGSVVTYLYNEERLLIQTHTKYEDHRERIITYEQGEKRMVEERRGPLVISMTKYLEDGNMVKTLFSGGQAYSDITYGQDGIKVLAITYY